MVKVLAISVFHKTAAATTELASAFELSQFGFFQRGTVQVYFCFWSLLLFASHGHLLRNS
jgi:hypothetical protein